MPRYFFNIVVRGRNAIADPEGDELAGDDEAQRHAVMVAREMLANRIWYKRGLEHWSFEIADATGRKVAVVPFSNLSPGGKRHRLR